MLAAFRTSFSSRYSAGYLLFFLSGISALIYEVAWLTGIQLIMGYIIGGLYAINTLGALVGCILAGYFLLPTLGYTRTMHVAAAINVFLFLLALLQFPLERFSWAELFPAAQPSTGPGFVAQTFRGLQS